MLTLANWDLKQSTAEADRNVIIFVGIYTIENSVLMMAIAKS